VLNFRADDGGATPVQDERDSGSDVEDEGNEQHSGSENGSVGHHSEVRLEPWVKITVLLIGFCLFICLKRHYYLS